MHFRFDVRWAALMVLLCLSGASRAQPNPILDSLLQQADHADRLPESTIVLLTDQAHNYTTPADRAAIHVRLSSAYLKTGQLDSAASNAWNVLTWVPGNTVYCSQAYLNLGLIAYQKSAFGRASDLFDKALPMLQTMGDSRGQLLAWNHLARIAERQDRLVEAIQFYQQAMTVSLGLHDTTSLGNLKFELAGVYRKLRRYPEAKSYLSQSLEDGRLRGDTSRLAAVFAEFGKIAEDQLDYASALDNYTLALQLGRKSGRKSTGYTNVSRVYGVMMKFDTASRYADSAEVAAIESGKGMDLRECFHWRYTLAGQLKDTAQAFRYYTRFVQYDDSVKREEVEQRIQNVHDELMLGANEASIRNAELELKLAEERAERDGQWQNFLFLMSGSLVLLALFLFYWIRSRNQAERRMREKEAKVAELTIMKEKLFTVMAHDLQGPVATITNLTESLVGQTKASSHEEVVDYLHNLNVSGLELSRSLNQLLEWAVTQSGTMPYRPDLVNCKQVADEVERQLRPLAEEKEIVVAFLIPEALHAYGDRAMIQIILRTLLYNAIRFTSEEHTITLFSGRKDELITLGVKDNGTGITEEQRKKIFDWSNSTSGAIGRRALGIGLPMCRELVIRNGGNLYVESKLNEGSTFYFTLPEHAPIA